MKKHFIIIILFLWVKAICAGEFSTYNALGDTCTGKLFVRLQNTSFIRNNEYSNKFTSGFTGIGFFFKPSFEYYLNSDTKINAGYFFLKYSGMDKLNQAIPIFTVRHQLTKKGELVFGNIFGTLNHQLAEPMFRFDRYYQNNVEYGVQFLWDSERFKSDFWINWEKYIQKSDPFQEMFVAGNSTRMHLLTAANYKVTLPVQLLGLHIGGQIDESPNSVLSILNGSAGLSYEYDIGKKKIALEQLILIYKGLNLPPPNDPNSQIYNKGYGSYSKLKYEHANFRLVIGYWSAYKFIAPRGEYLFQSVSEDDHSFFEDKRKVITAKASLSNDPGNMIRLILRGESYYDCVNKNIDYSYGFYLLINENIFIKRLGE